MNLRELYIDYFVKNNHVQIPSASIIPNDKTCLFNTAGMQPLVPYLMGEAHPKGKRLVDYQKCIRLTDIDDIGDSYHHTFFEMLGNWSLGNYFKEESIHYSYEFLTKVLNIPNERLAVTIFKGNDLVSKDEVSYNCWLKEGIEKNKIVFLEEDNWWGPVSVIGPCGPDTEIFYFRSDDPIPGNYDPNDKRWVEIWNNVFMEYNKDSEGKFTPLSQKNVDTGMGLERVTSILENVNDNYLTTIWKDIINKIEEISIYKYSENKESMRILADHIRTSVFILGDDAKIVPSNVDQGYVLRRIIRRLIRHARKLSIDLNSDFEITLAQMIINKYKKYYPELEKNQQFILDNLKQEKTKFSHTIEKGLKEFDKIIKSLSDNIINKDLAFRLYDTYGFPIELTEELAKEKKIEVDVLGFYDKFKEHQDRSRASADAKFKGGLASTGEIETKYHTATHLLNAALKEVLNKDVHQKGSNITSERLRFDFSYNNKMTDEQIKETEALVNKWIKEAIPVVCNEMTKEEALNGSAEAMFASKYDDVVKVYQIGNVSKEICGGPHVNNTNELGTFKIIKEEASSAGVRRIKAILE